MKTSTLLRSNKNRLCGVALGIGLALAASTAAHAMSELVSLSCDPMWPTSSTPDNTLVYNVTTVGRGGAGLLEVTLSAGNMPPGVTVTFSPSVLRFTGNQVASQKATMTVHCPYPLPLDCYAFTITGTAQRETITITNLVMFTIQQVATRPPLLYIDNLGNGNLRLRGLGATAKTYQIEAVPEVVSSAASGTAGTELSAPVWVPLGTATADGNGRFTFFTTTASGPMRFYRALELPQ